MVGSAAGGPPPRWLAASLLALLVACDAAPADGDDTAAPDTGDVDLDGPWTGNACPADATGREDAVLFGDGFREIDLTLSEAAIAGLAEEWDDDVEDVPATVVIDGASAEVGLRLRGGSGSFQPFSEKPAFKIDFAEYAPDARFLGLRYLVLKNMSQDDSMLDERGGLSLFAAGGVAAPRSGYAHVRVNGEYFGLYLVLEEMDTQDFVDRCFGDGTGAFYEGAETDLVAADVESFIVRLNGGLADPDEPIRRAVAALDDAGSEGFDAAFATWFDDESVLRTMAVELVGGNDDGYACFRNNYYLYQRPADGRLVMVGWGPDHGLRDADIDVHGDWPARLYGDCMASPACRARLDAHLLELVELFEAPGWPAWMAAEAARTEEDCLADPRSDEGAEGCIDGRDNVFDFIAERPAIVRAQLEGSR